MPKIRLNREQGRLLTVIVFLARLTLFSIPLYAVLWINPSFAVLQYAVRDETVLLAGFIGVDAEVDGFDVNLNTVDGPMTVNIAEDCTGWKSVIAYIALVFAVPKVDNRKRLISMIGIPVIYAANIVRIAFLLWVATSMGISEFRLFHEYLWKFGLSMVVLGAWYVWLVKTAGGIKAERFITY
jgi:exosortase/archaeosortase family protein